ncbi:hypothetical protein TVAG_190900 [Trichomonas vaginalis G3]|uniref:Uncharacterized protein n=1 Tax=Trichomonas vaginalis (strain ATCC PRA-98 / G3) TaxID=412133 RepID=A2EFH3_TRIV3|nr:MULE transposase domain-containing protein [Trichomonas vaginalis G3]EAY08567.1 hypothetical protein TVAG_190900 [Trichomonas vaginalis G3]KAI5497853.1 MULE transposase domain-containing protein [Trichomonas vaginalis G3]|eukprot:XP_001320790.1 hypothetical protein [Trichomonas vaginalis G3]
MISVDLEELIAFGIKQEVTGGVPYRRRTGSPKQYVTYSCSYPLCKAKFRVEEQNGVFTISKVNEEHCHHIGVEMGSHYASKFYQKWIELYIKNGGKQFLAQKAFFDKFGIDTNNKETMKLFAQSTDALKHKFYRLDEIIAQRLSNDPYTSLEAFLNNLQEECPDDLVQFDYNGDFSEFTIIYAPFAAKELVHSIDNPLHVNSTHSLIKGKIQLFAVTMKTSQNTIFPFCYFLVNLQTSEKIQECLVKFCEFAHLDPQHWSADCALNIARTIEDGFPLAQLSWCAVHVLRACAKVGSYFDNPQNFENFYLAMDFLTLRADATNAEKLAEESDETYEFWTTMLEEEEPRALKYFDKQWRRTKEHWMMLYRGEGDSTNNIAESHFHQLKQTFFLGKKNERIDDIVITLITVVIPNAIIKVQVANVLNEERAVRILTRAGNQIVEQRASKHDECLKLIQHILEIVESRRIEPNVLIPSLKAILNLAQRSLKEE